MAFKPFTTPLAMLLLLALATACDDSGDATGEPVEQSDAVISVDGGGLNDATADPPDAESMPDAEVMMDAEGMPDAEPQPDAMPQPDATPPPMVESCEDACARYDDCGRLDELLGGEAACQRICDRAARANGGQEPWFTCLESRTCDALRGCPPPEPDPLTCEQACGAILGCGIAVPMSDSDAEACEVWCGGLEEESGSAFGACGEIFLDACPEDDLPFWRCMGDTVVTECGTRCDRLAGCGELPFRGCVADCLEDVLDPDPLARRRAEQLNTCTIDAGIDCDAVGACLDPDANPNPGGASCQDFCMELSGVCPEVAPLVEQLLGGQCQPGCEQGLRDDPNFQNTVNCAVATIDAPPCPVDRLLECFLGMPMQDPDLPRCEALCEARALCEQLPEGVNEIACVTACQTALRQQGDAAEQQRGLLDCGQAGTCDELGACVDENSPETACQAYCGAQAGCMLLDGPIEGCVETCVERFGREREAAARACVAEIEGDPLDCDDVQGCLPPPPPPCGDICARLAMCELDAGFEGPDGCEATCDDQAFSNIGMVAQNLTCALGAPLCAPEAPLDPLAVSDCVAPDGRREPPDLTPCYSYCRATVECDPQAEITMTDCLTACGRGLPGADALRLSQASECLEQAGPGTTCQALTACVVGVNPTVNCDDHCGELEGCGLPAEGCEMACADMPPAVEVGGCVAEAERLEQGCATVAGCIDFEPPMPSADCQGLCDARAACDPSIDPFVCAVSCTPDPPGVAVQRACAENTGCGGIEACLQAGPAIPPLCDQICQRTVGCMPPWGDAAECRNECAGRSFSPDTPDGYLAEVDPCVAQAVIPACDQAAVQACFEPAVDCAGLCRAVEACNIFPPGLCELLVCPGGVLDPANPFAGCAQIAVANGRCDLDGFNECIGGGVPLPLP